MIFEIIGLSLSGLIILLYVRVVIKDYLLRKNLKGKGNFEDVTEAFEDIKERYEEIKDKTILDVKDLKLIRR